MTVMDRIHGRVKNGSSKSICVQHIGMGMTIELRNVRKPGDLLQLRIRRLGKCQNVAECQNVAGTNGVVHGIFVIAASAA